MYTIDMKNQIEEYIELINDELVKYIPTANDGQKEVVAAMKYSISNGGKRIRPILVLEFCKACGGNYLDAIPFACAIEFIHTYSLIHDDLPCMDNDDFRRGNPSCHKMYGEATALLAGDALLTHAFEAVTSAELSNDKIVDAVSLLSQNAGVAGMIGGQVLDLKFEQDDPTIVDILKVNKLKTGALISAACLLGCIAAGASDEQFVAASKFAYNLGVAFQIKDDLLDILGDAEKLGKPIGSDEENNKTNYVTLVGQDKAQRDVEKLTESAINQLSKFKNTDFIEKLAIYLVSRES